MMERTGERASRLHIGFVSTRFTGTDGVSLETEKWAAVLQELNHQVFYFAGSSSRDPQISRVVPEADFRFPEILDMHAVIFSNRVRPPEVTRRIWQVAGMLKDELHAFVKDFDIDLMIVENALSIPMHIPLGVALTEFIAETGLPVIGHHHDFYWERKRYLVTSAQDLLDMAFPATLPSIQHVVINSIAGAELSRRTGLSAMLVPNVMDFEHEPEPGNGYIDDLRPALGLDPEEYFLLQPTRVVQRKGIEHAIELVKRMEVRAQLVISHASQDEGLAYERRVRAFARLLGVRVNFVSDIFREQRGQTPDGRKVYALWDAYRACDLVTYPSSIEGFGNAFLEAVYFRKPLVVNNYSIFNVDIKPKGFQVVEFDEFITDQTVEATCQVLTNPDVARRMTDANYALAQRYFSYAVLRRRLQLLIHSAFGENRLLA